MRRVAEKRGKLVLPVPAWAELLVPVERTGNGEGAFRAGEARQQFGENMGLGYVIDHIEAGNQAEKCAVSLHFRGEFLERDRPDVHRRRCPAGKSGWMSDTETLHGAGVSAAGNPAFGGIRREEPKEEVRLGGHGLAGHGAAEVPPLTEQLPQEPAATGAGIQRREGRVDAPGRRTVRAAEEPFGRAGGGREQHVRPVVLDARGEDALLWRPLHWLVLLAACVGFLLAGDAALAVEVDRDTPPAFEVIGLDDRPGLKDSVRLSAQRARRAILEHSGLDWEGTARIIWAEEQAFLRQTGFHPENAAAAARPSDMTIWINARAWQRSTPHQQQETMTHECGHLLLGTLPGGRDLPLWANEGIVMHLAGQWSTEEHLRLLTAHTFGQLPRLADLEEGFPRDGPSQSLAYRMSYAAISVVAQNYGDDPGEVRRLVQRLADPILGPRLADEFWDEFRREGWQRATERSLGTRFTTAVIVMTGTSAIFLMIAILVIVAFIAVKKRRAERAAEMEEDEAWAESLTEDDIQDIYGDREERWDPDERE